MMNRISSSSNRSTRPVVITMNGLSEPSVIALGIGSWEMNSSGTSGRSRIEEPSSSSSYRWGNCSWDARTELARNSSRRLRSEKRLASRLSSTSKPVSLRIATSAERSAGCSYAREEIPGRRTRARSGTVVILSMLCAWRTTRAGDPGPPATGGLAPVGAVRSWQDGREPGGEGEKMFEPSAEAMPAEELASLQSERLRALVGRLLAAGGIQAERLRAAGVTAPDDITLADLPRLPMVAKADLWAAYPFGMIQVPAEDLVAVHGSSGTGGRPTLVGYTRADLKLWARMCARALAAAGATRASIVHNAYGYGLFTGGVGIHQG